MTDDKALLTLERLKKNELVEVTGFERISKEVVDRLLAMGIAKGAEVKIVRFAPLGDPIDIEVKGTNLSLRKEEAKLILVRRK